MRLGVDCRPKTTTNSIESGVTLAHTRYCRVKSCSFDYGRFNFVGYFLGRQRVTYAMAELVLKIFVHETFAYPVSTVLFVRDIFTAL